MLRKLLMKLFLSALGKEIKGAAEGKKGPKAKSAYDLMKGKKTVTGVVLGFAAAGAGALGMPEVAGAIGTIAAFVIGVGLVDKNWRSEVPASAFLAKARDYAPDITAAAAGLVAWSQTCSPQAAAILSKVSLSCATATTIFIGISGGVAWVLLEAKMAEPPNGGSGK